MKLFLDDRRDAPEGWTLVRDPEEVIRLLLSETVEEASLDHDLGRGVMTGYDVLRVLEDEVYRVMDFKVPKIRVHSSNPSGRARMELAVKAIITRAELNRLRLNFIRTEGGCLCPICGKEHRQHPVDDEMPFLHILCDGTRVKL